MPRGSNQRGRQRGQYAEITNADRQRLIRAYEGGEQDYHEVAETLQINRSTAYSIIRRHRNGLPLQRIRGGRRPQVVVLTDEVVQRIVKIIEEHSTTKTEIREQLEDLHNVVAPQRPPAVCLSTCHLQIMRDIVVRLIEDRQTMYQSSEMC